MGYNAWYLDAIDELSAQAKIMNVDRFDKQVIIDQLARICKEGFGNDDTISNEPADDYVLRQLATLRALVAQQQTHIDQCEAAIRSAIDLPECDTATLKSMLAVLKGTSTECTTK